MPREIEGTWITVESSILTVVTERQVGSYTGKTVGTVTSRMKVPKGWLYREVTSEGGVALCFVKDISDLEALAEVGEELDG